MSIELCTSTLKKLNSKIIPFIIICYFVANLDKTNISIAALQMNADLGLTASMYGLGVGMFYISYIIFEIPSNLIMTRVGARIWIARIMITWGMVSAGMAFVQTPTQLYIMRFLLGMAEAGFTPGIIYYISCWFPKRNRARAMSFFYMGSVLASIIGLPVSGLILNMHGIADVAGWRWLFAIEGVPAIVLGALVLWLLPSSPQKAAWLSEAEKGWLTAQIAADNRGAVVNQHASWLSALKNKVVLLLSLVWFLQAFGSIGITLFLPLILKSMASEQSDVVISLLSAVPFIFACLFMYLNGRHSDLTGERAGAAADSGRSLAGCRHLCRQPAGCLSAAGAHRGLQFRANAGVLGGDHREAGGRGGRGLHCIYQHHRQFCRLRLAAAARED